MARQLGRAHFARLYAAPVGGEEPLGVARLESGRVAVQLLPRTCSLGTRGRAVALTMWMPRGPGSQPRRLRNARGDRRPTFAFRAQPRVRAALSPGGAGGGWQGQRRPEG